MLPPTWTAMADRSLNRPPPWHPGTPGLSILPKNSRTPVVVPHSNSTSNHNRFASVKQALDVVSHSNSTSNHNWPQPTAFPARVVSHSNSTSNHNVRHMEGTRGRSCFSFQFYIKPQRRWDARTSACCCFSFQFYIKPQLGKRKFRYHQVVSHSNSTSNHNYYLR